MKFKNKLSIFLCLSTIFHGGGVSKAMSTWDQGGYLYSQNIYEDSDDDYDDDAFEKKEILTLPTQNLIILSLFVGIVGLSVNEIMDYYYDCKLKKIKNNILLFPMKVPNESELRQNPMNHFEKNEENIYLKNIAGNSFDCGKFSFPSLREVENKANNVQTNKDGKLDIIYGENNNYHNVEIAKLIDTGYFDLVVPASNFNAIETLGLSDGNKKFVDYLDDPTQGPDCMEKFPCTSLVLLHIFNGKSKYVAIKFIPGCGDLIEQKSKQCELNILKPYGIKTSNGYVVNGNLSNNFKNKDNDSKYRVAYIEGAPVWYEGGYKFCAVNNNRNRMHENDNVFGKNFNFCQNPKKVNIFIDACIPYEKSGYPGTSEENIKAHLRRHYKMLINLCKAKKIKRALFPLSGSGVFGVPAKWHYEILHELQNLIKDSGTHFFLNAFKEPDRKNIPNCDSFNFVQITSDSSLRQLMIK